MIAEQFIDHPATEDAMVAVEENARQSEGECRSVFTFPDNSMLEISSFQGQPATVEAFASADRSVDAPDV